MAGAAFTFFTVPDTPLTLAPSPEVFSRFRGNFRTRIHSFYAKVHFFKGSKVTSIFYNKALD